MGNQDMNEILQGILSQETEFKKDLGSLEHVLKRADAKEALHSVIKHLAHSQETIHKLDPNDYRKIEFVKSVPDCKNRKYFPKLITEPGVSAKDLISQILRAQEAHLQFYTDLKREAVFPRSKDLCELFLTYKTAQLKETKRILDGLELTV